MHQFEIELDPGECESFDASLWEFLARVGHVADGPDISLHMHRGDGVERRVVEMNDKVLAKAFTDHLKAFQKRARRQSFGI